MHPQLWFWMPCWWTGEGGSATFMEDIEEVLTGRIGGNRAAVLDWSDVLWWCWSSVSRSLIVSGSSMTPFIFCAAGIIALVEGDADCWPSGQRCRRSFRNHFFSIFKISIHPVTAVPSEEVHPRRQFHIQTTDVPFCYWGQPDAILHSDDGNP